MTRRSAAPTRNAAVVAVAAVLALALGGCAEPAATHPPADRTVPVASGAGVLPAEAQHIHGAGLDPDRGDVYVATHGGLYVVTATAVRRVGPAADLMGFAIAPDGRFLASGHPAPGTDLPEPAGLLESRDRGRTWTSVSRGGRSDFHALTAAGAGAVGFDGELRRSADGRAWQTGRIDVHPHALAADRRGRVVLATTEDGLRRSTDGGRSFAAVAGAPLLLLVASNGGTRFTGVTPGGEIWSSADDGVTWRVRGAVPGQEPQALAAAGDAVAVVFDGQVLVSADGGATFAAPGADRP